MTVENISWSISTKECCRPRRGLNLRPPDLQSDGASNWATEAGQLEEKFWQCGEKVKDHPRIIIWTNLVDLASPMLYTKILPQSFLGSGGGFEVFLTIWAWQPSCSILQNHLIKLLVPLSQKLPCEWNLLKFGVQFQRRSHLEICKILYMYKALGARDNTPWGIKVLF